MNSEKEFDLEGFTKKASEEDMMTDGIREEVSREMNKMEDEYMSNLEKEEYIKDVIAKVIESYDYGYWYKENEIDSSKIDNDFTFGGGTCWRQLNRFVSSNVKSIQSEIDKNFEEYNDKKFKKIIETYIVHFLNGKAKDIKKERSIKANTKDLYGLTALSFEALKKQKFDKSKAILGDWLTERMSCFLHASSGVGKSWFALSCAVAVASEGTFGNWENKEAKKVLYIDGEMSIYELQKNSKFLSETMGSREELLDKNLIFLSKNYQELDVNFIEIDNENHKLFLEEKVKEHNIGLIIFDNVRTLSNMTSENDAQSWIPINRLVTSLKTLCSVMVVHHDRKGNSGSESFSGNTNAITVFESRISLKKMNSATHNELRSVGKGACFSVSFEKFRGLRTKDTENIIFGLHEKEGWKYQADDLNLMEKILDYLKSSLYVNQKEIAMELGIDQTRFTRLKQRMIGSKMITDDEFTSYLDSAKQLKKLVSEK